MTVANKEKRYFSTHSPKVLLQQKVYGISIRSPLKEEHEETKTQYNNPNHDVLTRLLGHFRFSQEGMLSLLMNLNTFSKKNKINSNLSP